MLGRATKHKRANGADAASDSHKRERNETDHENSLEGLHSTDLSALGSAAPSSPADPSRAARLG